jgi:hypothetical protein
MGTNRDFGPLYDLSQEAEANKNPLFCRYSFYGARGTRTPDLLGAIQALSQLSYSPLCVR